MDTRIHAYVCKRMVLTSTTDEHQRREERVTRKRENMQTKRKKASERREFQFIDDAQARYA